MATNEEYSFEVLCRALLQHDAQRGNVTPHDTLMQHREPIVVGGLGADTSSNESLHNASYVVLEVGASVAKPSSHKVEGRTAQLQSKRDEKDCTYKMSTTAELSQ